MVDFGSIGFISLLLKCTLAHTLLNIKYHVDCRFNAIILFHLFQMLYKKLFVLLDKYLDNQNSIQRFIKTTNLFQHVKNEFLVKILSTELLYGRKSLPCIENNTMNIVRKAYDLYCDQNKNSGMLLIFKILISFCFRKFKIKNKH